MLYVRIVWEKVKKYWKIVLAVIGAVAAFIVGAYTFGAGGQGDLTKKLEAANKAHDDAIKQIRDANSTQAAKTTEAAANLSKTLDAVEQQYQAQNLKLDAAKKKQIADLVQGHDGDDDALLKKLADATGFPVVLN